MGRTYIYNQRIINMKNYQKQTKECEKVYGWRNSPTNKCPPFEKSPFIGLANSSKFHYNVVKSKFSSNEYCERVPDPYDQIYEKSSFVLNGFPTSMIDSKNDLRSSENILQEWKEVHCKMINLSRKLRSKTFQDPIIEKVPLYSLTNAFYLFIFHNSLIFITFHFD